MLPLLATPIRPVPSYVYLLATTGLPQADACQLGTTSSASGRSAGPQYCPCPSPILHKSSLACHQKRPSARTHGGCRPAMRRPHAAAAATALAALLLLVLCLAAALTRHGSGICQQAGRTPTRKMLLAMTSFDDDDAAASPSPSGHHRHPHHHHQHQHHHHHHAGRRRWNRRQGTIPPPSDDAGEAQAVDPRYGVQKRLVPSGPNPLHH
jgi:hypothetical protein